jgi:asparagine synthase (glutamine-hydrolysing)
LVEFACTLPVHLKIKSNETKYLLKQVMGSYLPGKILSRPKQGFGVPLSRWFRHDLRQFSNETLLDPANRISQYVNLDMVKRMLSLHQERHVELGEEIWSLVLFEFWLRTFVH